MNSVLSYQLERLEHIIKTDLLTLKHGDRKETAQRVNDLHKQLRAEVDRIKKIFIQEVFVFEGERQLEKYIQLHQQELIRLTDELLTRNKSDSAGEYIHGLPGTLSFVYAFLDELLEFIERHFTRYFDQDKKAPESYIILAGAEILKSFGDLQAQMKKAEVNPLLIDLSLFPLHTFIEEIPGGQITYRRIFYAKEVLHELNRLMSSSTEDSQWGNREEALRNTFLYLNYNSIKYFRYYTQHINELVGAIETSSGRIEQLSYLLKNINQTQVKPEVGHDRTIRSLKEQLVDWLAEEISYHDRLHQLHNKQSVSQVVAEGFKLKMELSVPQLSYLLKILIETRLVQNKNVAELFRFFARYFQTKRLENIAYETFRVKYYNTEESTRKNVRSILLSLVDHINKT